MAPRSGPPGSVLCALASTGLVFVVIGGCSFDDFLAVDVTNRCAESMSVTVGFDGTGGLFVPDAVELAPGERDGVALVGLDEHRFHVWVTSVDGSVLVDDEVLGLDDVIVESSTQYVIEIDGDRCGVAKAFGSPDS